MNQECPRGRRGAVDFETTETQIVCDDNGRIEKIVPRTRTEAHRLIEEAMLAANVCSADFIEQGGQPGLFRVHEGPTPEKIEILRNFLRTMGVPLSVSDEPTTEEFAAIADATKDRPDAEQIHMMLLRSMQQAIYTPTNSGHFGLAYDGYTHFTSPIRRYPDLLVHRVIKSILLGQRYVLPALPTPGEAHAKLSKRLEKTAAARGRPVPARKSSAEIQAWEAAGLHCSANERRADEASRDVEAWLKCKYMRDFLGEEFGGRVTTVTSFGLFVTLDAMYVEGLVHITELGSDYFRFDEARQELRGERTGVRFALGSRVQVQVIRVDLDGRRIDFRLVRAGEEAVAAGAAQKRSASKRANAGNPGEAEQADAEAYADDEVVWQPRKRSTRATRDNRSGDAASKRKTARVPATAARLGVKTVSAVKPAAKPASRSARKSTGGKR